MSSRKELVLELTLIEISLVTWTSPPWRRRALPTGSPSMGSMAGPEEKEDNDDIGDEGDRDWLS